MYRHYSWTLLICVVSVILLQACQSSPRHVPVIDIMKYQSNFQPQRTRVQSLRVAKQKDLHKVVTNRELHPIVLPSISTHQSINFSAKHWTWPVNKRRIIQSFSSVHKGINLSGSKGDSIFATAAGRIVYAGNGLRGYGNLIIIKHDQRYLSAYAHQQIMYVKEGDWVIQGQKIADMGNTGTEQVMLHFEVRLNGQPINPLTLPGLATK